MLFFSEKVAEINATQPELLGRVDDPEREEGEGTEQQSQADTGRGLSFATFSMIGEVVQFTRLNINEVWRMEAAEFFAYVAFLIARNRRREQEIQKIRMR